MGIENPPPASRIGVLLVSCYELGHQPVNLASPLAVLEAAGYQPRAVDTAVEDLPDELIREARLVAISVPMHTALRLGEPLARRVREINPAAHICVYGLYAWLNAGYLLGGGMEAAFARESALTLPSPAAAGEARPRRDHAGAGFKPVPTNPARVADSVIGGEFEEPLLELARWLEQENDGLTLPSPAAAAELRPRQDYVGAGFKPAPTTPARVADSVIGGEFEEPLLELARWLERGNDLSGSIGPPPEGVAFPGLVAPPYLRRPEYVVPRRDGLPPLERYAGLWRNGTVVPAGYVEATRGCKHTCAHCPITPVYRGRFFAVPRDIVLEDIRRQVHAGAEHITFGDPDFLNGPTHALRVVREMHAEFPELTFDATIKVEHILRHSDIFPELKELGCAFVVSAVESLSNTVLERLRKGHTKSDVTAALHITSAAGIALRASLVSFTPWTTLEDYLELIHFVESHRLVDNIDPVHYGIRLLIPPGSALLDEPDAAEWLGEFDPAAYGYGWRHPDPRMDALYEDVSRIVAEGAVAGGDAVEVFAQVKRAAHRWAGLAVDEDTVRQLTGDRALPPRLTESWFC